MLTEILTALLWIGLDGIATRNPVTRTYLAMFVSKLDVSPHRSIHYKQHLEGLNKAQILFHVSTDGWIVH